MIWIQDRTIFVYESHDEERFINKFKSMLRVECKDRSEISPVTSDREFWVSAESLSRTWGIGSLAAQRTLKATTQRGVRTVAFPSVERRWPTWDLALRYRKLNHAVYHYTLKLSVTSLRGNRCSEMYASRNFPIKRKSDVHETLDIFLSRYGIPEALISDGAKAYTGGQCCQKERDAGCFCKLTDPYSPWQNRAEGEIREVKRLAGGWMIKSQSPRRLWDYCLELASIVWSHMAHDMYKLQGEVPETIIIGQTADISFICEF
jgi:hypothetical protein